MSRLSAILRSGEDGSVLFWCPGCDGGHRVHVNGPAPAHGMNRGASWQWNGSPEKPSLSPSILIRSGHHVPGQEGKRCWCTYNAEQVAAGKEPSGFTCSVCHSFVTDGRIQFLSDCTHPLAGQTVDIPEWPR